MKLHVAVKLLRLLNSRPEAALTVREIERKWYRHGGPEIVLRSFQRYMDELSADGADGPALVATVEQSGQAKKYYLRLSQVASWFMTEEAALQLLLTRQVLARNFALLDPEVEQISADMADALTENSVKLRRLRERLRIVPDGIGRLPARIDSEVLATAVEAVAAGQQLTFEYVGSGGQCDEPTCSPLGLIAKDGTIYLLGKIALKDTLRHFALHRMAFARVINQQAYTPAGFNLDRYIWESHQFSHRLHQEQPPLSVTLRVAPEALWHFRERPLSIDQRIDDVLGKDGWYMVMASVPDTILLLPFLLSMGPWIEVVEPAGLRQQLASRLVAAVAHYQPADSVE